MSPLFVKLKYVFNFQVRPVSLCFGKAFQKPSGAMTNSKIHPDQTDGTVSYSKAVQNVVFEVGLEVKEEDGKVNYVSKNPLLKSTIIEKRLFFGNIASSSSGFRLKVKHLGREKFVLT